MQPAAVRTISGQSRFHPAEIILLLGIQKIDQPMFHHITQLPFRTHEEIAGIHIAVMLHHDINTAFFVKRTLRRPLPHVLMQHSFEKAYGRRRSVVNEICVPQIKNTAEK